MKRRWCRRAVAAMGLGLVLWLVHVVSVSFVEWRPLDIELPVAAGGAATGRFVAAADGRYEIEIQVPATIDGDALERLILATGGSELPLTWSVHGEQRAVAGGDARDYLYLDTGPGTRVGPLRRALLKVPLGQDRERLRSFGLFGELTAARGIGAFDAERGRRYAITATLDRAVDALPPARTRIVVRRSRRAWDQRYLRTAWLAYAGLGLAVLGVAGIAGCVVLRGSNRSRSRGQPA